MFHRLPENSRVFARRRPPRTWTVLAAVLSWFAAWQIVCQTSSTAQAKDYFLTIGGGYDPTGNQASLEENVLLYQKLLDHERPDHPQHDIYFADGDDPQRDVQYEDEQAKEKCPPARQIMAELFGEVESVGVGYRDHKIPGVTGPTDFKVLQRRFTQLGRELKAGDRLIIYATGHGGEARDRSQDKSKHDEAEAEQKPTEAANPPAPPEAPKKVAAKESPFNHYDTSLYLWDNDELTATEFCGWLDRLPRDVTVILVMVQCYSGGFSHAIFERNDVELGLSSRHRCGFFSQVFNRTAAGCAPEPAAHDAEEYSRFFLAALSGKSPKGEKISADYDRDGTVSLAEAHAYTVIESDTVDIPVRTSEELLRRYSRFNEPFDSLRKDDETDAATDEAPPKKEGSPSNGAAREASRPTVDLRDPTGAIADLLPLARPDQRAILEQLPGKLEGTRPLTVEDVRSKLEQVQDALDVAQTAINASMDTTDQALATAQDDVNALYPELRSTYSPTAAALMSERADEFVSAVSGLGSYEALGAARKREEDLSESLESAERTEAKLERLLRTIEDVVLAENLPKVASGEIVARYKEMIAMEEQSLSPPKADKRARDTKN